MLLVISIVAWAERGLGVCMLVFVLVLRDWRCACTLSSSPPPSLFLRPPSLPIALAPEEPAARPSQCAPRDGGFVCVCVCVSTDIEAEEPSVRVRADDEEADAECEDEDENGEDEDEEEEYESRCTG